MDNDKWEQLPKWGKELIVWIFRVAPDIHESNTTLRFFVKDGVLYTSGENRESKRNQSPEMTFEKELKNPLSTT